MRCWLVVWLAATYLNLCDYVESVGVALIRKVDANKRIHNIVPVARDPVETLVEVLPRVLNPCATAQHRKARKHDEQQNNQLNGADQVHQSYRPFRAKQAKKRKQGIRGHRKPFVLPLGRRVAGCAVDVAREDYGVAAAEGEDYGEEGVHGGEEEGGLRVGLFEVGDLAARAVGEEGCVFEVDGEGGCFLLALDRN